MFSSLEIARATVLIILPLALLIGVVLGALGSGGAILALPVLVYAGGLAPTSAIAVSQLVVGVASLFGGTLQMISGNVSIRSAILYAAAGVPATKIGTLIRERLPENFLMGAFAAIIVVAGLRMLNHRPDSKAGLTHPVLSLSIAATVGLVTGMLGVGGGFLLVPAMIAFGGLPTRSAMATSLPVIALNSLSGAYQSQALWRPHLDMALGFLGATLVGTFLGIRFAKSAPEAKLRAALAWTLVLVGLGVGATSWF